MNKLFEYQKKQKEVITAELAITLEERKKLSFKEKYGKCNSKCKRTGFDPTDMGFYGINPKRIPAGFNYLLGYCEDVI